MKEIEKIKRQLLQETNYRCGYCMKNITPRMYYIEYDATNSVPVFDYHFYNVHDRAHIEPNSIKHDDGKDVDNLLALCKQCHWEIDKPKMITTKELKRQKLYWIVASGRFSRLEIDLMMKLFQKHPDTINDLACKIEERTIPIYSYRTNHYNKFLFQNIIEKEFVEPYLKDSGVTLSGEKQDMIYIYLLPNGEEFCKKFIDVYEDL